LDCKRPVEIYWNKSDTDSHTVIAVSTKRIGVDIEYKKERPFEKISQRYFETSEVTGNKEIFYDTWTRKEAYTKWKRDKIANNLRGTIDRPMIPLEGLPDNVVGYLCT
jgi:phosphopantetheinyl transferase